MIHRMQRAALTPTPLLLLFVLIFFCTSSVCLPAATVSRQHRRHRRTGSAHPIAVVHEVPQKKTYSWQANTAAAEKHLNTNWTPLRINVFTEDLNDPTRYCNETEVERPDYKGGAARCTENDVLTVKKKNLLTLEIIPAAVRLHSVRLLVQRERGLLVVPHFDSLVCSSVTVPPSHRSVGVDGADMLFYSASGPAGGTVVAKGTTCAVLKNGRPVVGMITFAANYIAFTRTVVRITAHEIAHALGFNYAMMKRLKMLSDIPNVRGKPRVTVVSSNITRDKARAHYNCSRLEGMELEDEDLFRRTALSHWERRNAKDELMAGIVGAGYYTALTMAAFEDMGFFKANWGMEEPMPWGRNAGCELLEEKCLTNNISKYPEMFCNETLGSTFYCTTDRRALGYCTLGTHQDAIPLQYRYFTKENLGGGGNDLMDYCPVIAAYQNSWCVDGEQKFLPGSRVGPNSRCVKGDSLHVFLVHIGDVCADVLCEKDVVSVRYAGDDAWHVCPEGGYITPVRTFSSGRIICPRRSEVCNDGDMKVDFFLSVLFLAILAYHLL